MTSQDPNGMSSRDNSSNQPWNYTALLSCNGKPNLFFQYHAKKSKVLTCFRPFAGNLDLHFHPKPRIEQCFVSEAAQRVKGESEKKDKERTRMDKDLAGLDPITVEKSYPGMYSFMKCDRELCY